MWSGHAEHLQKKEQLRVWLSQMRLQFFARRSALESVSIHPIAEGYHGLCGMHLEQQVEAFSM